MNKFGEKGLDIIGIIELIELDDPPAVIEAKAAQEVLGSDERNSDGSDSELSGMEALRVSEVCYKNQLQTRIFNY